VLVLAFAVQILFMCGAPLALGAYFVRRGFGSPRAQESGAELGRGSWKLFFAGALTFLGSQVVHIPLVVGLTLLGKLPTFPHPAGPWKLVVNSVVLGLAAGACEEPARSITLRRFTRAARGWRAALMLGAGHGGAESFLLGALSALSLLAMLVLRTVGPERFGVGVEKASALTAAMHKYWSLSPWLPLVGAGERAMAMTIHLAASALVMRGVVLGRARWLAAAIVYHALVDAAAVYTAGRWGTTGAELITLGFTAGAAGILFFTYTSDSGRCHYTSSQRDTP
jgi:uncharacterized membrane protein YhfC